MSRSFGLKARWRLGIIVFLIVSGSMLTFIRPFSLSAQLENDLARAVRMYRIGYASHIDLADFTQFNWDVVYIFRPITPEAEIFNALGYEWSYAKWAVPSKSESTSLLVFVLDDRVVRWVEIERELIDFENIFSDSPIQKKFALFVFTSESNSKIQRIQSR